MRYLIKFSYDGSRYCGFQRQPRKKTVQEELEIALTKINNDNSVKIHASGRTDKGVHALAQIAHFDLDITITEHKLKRALNSNLPEDIHIIKAQEVEEEFHARYHVKSKKYQYILNLGEYNPIERAYVFQYNYTLDLKAMKKALKYFRGTHDFRAFVTENVAKENCVRTIHKVFLKKDKNNKEKIIITFEGNGFLRYQVRNMVGILLKVGQKKIKPEKVKDILQSKDRSKNGATAPSEGLYLVAVKYGKISKKG